PLQDPALPCHHRLDVRGVGEHGDHDVRPFGHLPSAPRHGGALPPQRLRLLRAPVVDDQLVAGGQEVPGHRPAHDAQPDESDALRHLRPPSPAPVSTLSPPPSGRSRAAPGSGAATPSNPSLRTGRSPLLASAGSHARLSSVVPPAGTYSR